MKKGAKIAVGVLAALTVLGGAGLYLSQTYIKWKAMEYEILPNFADGTDITDLVEKAVAWLTMHSF